MFRHLFLSGGSRKGLAGAAGAATALLGASSQAFAESDAAAGDKLCIDKLACHRDVPPPRIPTVLVGCGSFNPPTIAHLRMFDLATAALRERGHDVWGCYMSPVADAYGKEGLAPLQHRLEMCRLAAAGTDNVMVDAWEAAQPGYTRTLQVLKHVASSLHDCMQPQQQAGGAAAAAPAAAGTSSSSSDVIHAHGLAAAAAAAANFSVTADHAAVEAPTSSSSSSSSSGNGNGSSGGGGVGSLVGGAAPLPRVMLVCGADLLATVNQPGVWKDPDVILGDHGIVCVCRAGTDVQQLLQAPGSVLQQYRDNVVVVEEPVANDISSTRVRQLLAQQQPVRYLVPDAVVAYIQEHGLYSNEAA